MHPMPIILGYQRKWELNLMMKPCSSCQMHVEASKQDKCLPRKLQIENTLQYMPVLWCCPQNCGELPPSQYIVATVHARSLVETWTCFHWFHCDCVGEKDMHCVVKFSECRSAEDNYFLWQIWFSMGVYNFIFFVECRFWGIKIWQHELLKPKPPNSQQPNFLTIQYQLA